MNTVMEPIPNILTRRFIEKVLLRAEMLDHKKISLIYEGTRSFRTQDRFFRVTTSDVEDGERVLKILYAECLFIISHNFEGIFLGTNKYASYTQAYDDLIKKLEAGK